MITLEFWNTCDLNDILYQMGFRQKRFYQNTVLSEPKHEYEEDGVKNGDKEFFPLHQTLRKRYHFDVVVPEYELDALTMLPMHEKVRLTDELGNVSFIKDIEVTPEEWRGRWCRVRIWFSTHSYSKTPKCRNMQIGIPS